MGRLRDTNIIVQPQQSRTEYVTKTVNIHRQSTSEDAKLLRELEDKAAEAITDTIFHTLKPIEITCAEVHKTDSHIQCTKLILIIFNLNGQKFEREIEHDEWHYLGDRERTIKIYELIAKEIALMLMDKVLSNRNGLV